MRDRSLLCFAFLWLLVGGIYSLLAGWSLVSEEGPVRSFGWMATLSGPWLRNGWLLFGGVVVLYRTCGRAMPRWVPVLFFGALALLACVSVVFSIPPARLSPVPCWALAAALTLLIPLLWKNEAPLSVPETYAVLALIAYPFVLLASGRQALPSQAAWADSGLLFLWLAPLSLAILLPALMMRAGRELQEEGAARFGFWVLLLFGGWVGAARIASGPVPAWVGTAGIAAALLVGLAAVAWLVVLVPLLRGGGWDRIRFSAGGGFLLVAVFSFPVWILLVWLTAFRGIGSHLHLTLFDAAVDHLALLGLGTMALLGYLARPSRRHRAAFWLIAGGLLFLVGGEMVGGVLQALAFTDPAVPFAAVGSLLKPFLWMRVIGWGFFDLGVLVYLAGFWGRGAR